MVKREIPDDMKEEVEEKRHELIGQSFPSLRTCILSVSIIACVICPLDVVVYDGCIRFPVVEHLSNADEILGEMFLEEKEPTIEDIHVSEANSALLDGTLRGVLRSMHCYKAVMIFRFRIF